LKEDVDWKVGEEIIIAGTRMHNECHETRIITAVSGRTLTFAEPLECEHISERP